MNIQGITFLVLVFVLVILFIQKLIKSRNLIIELEDTREQLDSVENDLSNSQTELGALNLKFQEQGNKFQISNELSAQKILGYETKYGHIINADQEIEARTKSIQLLSNQLSELNLKYQTALQVYQSLEDEIELYKDNLDLNSYGLYQPKYSFEFPEQYLVELEGCYTKQKAMIKSENAITCHTNWEVGGSIAQGKKMIKQEMKLMLYAFNGECDAIIAKVKWNNVVKSRERMMKSYADINKLGAVTNVVITLEFYELKQEELALTFEYERKNHERKEEQRLIREQMREEEKAQREFERARREADEEAKMYEKILAKAREELGLASKEEENELQLKIKELEGKLNQALENSERARSQAQDTKKGYIYVISNIGSFGENVYKIGMTRRLEPMDRIHELSDAALPFQFDVHALIYSDNAPEFERGLHKNFWEKRINLANARKEFFKITLEEIEKHVLESNATIQFTKLAEAREYRQTLSLLDTSKSKNQAIDMKPKFPDTLN